MMLRLRLAQSRVMGWPPVAAEPAPLPGTVPQMAVPFVEGPLEAGHLQAAARLVVALEVGEAVAPDGLIVLQVLPVSADRHPRLGGRGGRNGAKHDG